MEIKTSYIGDLRLRNKKERFAVSLEENAVMFLWVPDISKPDHDHITITKKEAEKLVLHLANELGMIIE